MSEYVVPDVIGEPIRAWRTWFVVPEDKTSGPLRLQSIVYGYMWEPKQVQKASCNATIRRLEDLLEHEAPEEDHSCGIYAVDRDEVDRYYRDPTYTARSGCMQIWKVVGEVAMWGKVIQGARGYRAQYAYPTKLQIPRVLKGQEMHLTAREVKIALEHYECEVEIIEDTLQLPRTV